MPLCAVALGFHMYRACLNSIEFGHTLTLFDLPNSSAAWEAELLADVYHEIHPYVACPHISSPFAIWPYAVRIPGL